MATKLTIRDIARLAGVSKSTVSRVLTEHPNVDPATVERVRQVIAEHDFVPSLHASALKGKNLLIGVIVPTLTWTLIPEVILGIASVIEPSTYELLLFTSNPTKGYKDVIDRILAMRLVAGLLVVAYAPVPDELIDLPNQGIPVVLVDIVARKPSLPRVGDDNFGGAYAAVRYLLDQGHQRIAYIQGQDFPCWTERYQGYCAALRDAGIEPDPTYYFQGTVLHLDGRNALEAIERMPGKDRPTAIFATSDYQAYGILASAEEYGFRIPEDLAVIGYNDLPTSAHVRPALTTVRQPFQDMGHCAADLLLSLLDTNRPFPEQWLSASSQLEELPAAVEQPLPLTELSITLPTPLTIRASCGAKLARSALDNK